MKSRVLQTVVILSLFFIFPDRCYPNPHADKPGLVVLLVVDQMRADHLTRFADLYKYGFARLLEEGAVFTNAYHDHAYTVTAPGHATIATGAFPSHHGIVANDWFDRRQQKKVYCCEDTASGLLGYPGLPEDKGRSPGRMLLPTFGDWLKAASPESKVFGVARKDRAAILSAGHSADGVYWYNPADGKMITSQYYTGSYPQWVQDFNQARLVDTYFQQGWARMMPEELYRRAREDRNAFENDGEKTSFPYMFTASSNRPDRNYYDALQTTPFADKLILEFARGLVQNEGLGTGAATDVLFVGCSAADAIGHRFGPMSQESMDHFLRLDRYLGDFFAYLDAHLGRNRYLVVLSSDHGGLPIPEELARHGFAAQRVMGSDLRNLLSKAIDEVTKKLGLSRPLIKRMVGFGLFLNYEEAEELGVSENTINTMLATRLQENRAIAAVYTRENLNHPGHDGDEFLEAYRHSYHPERSGDLVVRFKKYCLLRASRYGTSHGSPYDYDTHVPLVFWGAPVRKSHTTQEVHTVDIAPTLAHILGVQPANSIDGHNLGSLLFTSDASDRE